MVRFLDKFLLFFVFLLVCSSFVFGVKPSPQVSVSDYGLVVVYPKAQAFTFGEGFDLYFHVFNSTDGLPLTNDSVNCTIHIYNHSDNEHIITARLTYIGNYDWEYEGNISYFTDIGFYPYITYCWSGVWGGGFVSDEIFISVDGSGEPSSNSIFFSGVIILLPLLFGFLLMRWVGYLGDEHNVIRLFLSLLSVGTLFVSLWFSGVVVVKFYIWSSMSDTLGTFTNIFGWVYFVIIIYFIIYLLVSIFKGIQNNKQEKMDL